MSPVLIVWEHGGQLGHLARLIPVAQALRARGYPVVVATRNPAAVQPYFDAIGMTLVEAPRLARLHAGGSSLLCPADILLSCGFDSPAAALVCVLQWLALFDNVKPGAVLVDASPMAQYAANLAGLHVVALGHGFELPPAVPGVSFAPWMDATEAAKAQVADSEERLVYAMADLGKRISLSAADVWQYDPTGLLNASQRALCTWPELDHFERDLPAHDYIGPIWHGLPNAMTVDWPDKPGPKVLCYLAIVDKRHDFLWQALLKQQANVLVVSPAGLPRACEAARGWSITVHTQLVELHALLPACDAVISTGGMGLTSMALHAGKPLMLMPTQLEQALLAYQLLRKGLVVSTMRHQNQQQVRARVDQLLNDAGLIQRAKKFASNHAGFTPQMAIVRLIGMLVGGESAASKSVKTIGGTKAAEINESNKFTC